MPSTLNSRMTMTLVGVEVLEIAEIEEDDDADEASPG